MAAYNLMPHEFQKKLLIIWIFSTLSIASIRSTLLCLRHKWSKLLKLWYARALWWYTGGNSFLCALIWGLRKVAVKNVVPHFVRLYTNQSVMLLDLKLNWIYFTTKSGTFLPFVQMHNRQTDRQTWIPICVDRGIFLWWWHMTLCHKGHRLS